MIPQITEINFPSYATLNSATITLSEMGDRNITTQIKIDGDIVPDFSGWELEFKGERFILPVKEPQAAKDNTSRRSIVDLTFSSWAVQEMKRYFFVEMTSIESGTAIADKYKASLGLNIENFVTAFNNVLNYYFNGNIEMDLFGSGTGIYSAEPAFFEIDYTHIWDVLQKIYEIYEVRWTITYDSTTEKYVIKVGYPAAEIDDHEFEYGYEGGLLRFERQVQDYDITNILLGRGGEKNLPYRYFKKVDPSNPNWAADPDAIPELKNIYFENLRDINFRRYVQGWKTNPNRILEEGDVVEAYDSARGETDFAYAKGHTDERFNPVEYVKDDASIAIYGERWGALENADDIYPTIQGIEVDPYGRIDQVVDVEPVTTDDIEAMAADAAEVTNVAGASRTEWINYNSTLELDINGADFSVPEGKVGNLTIQNTWFDTILYAKRGNDQVNVDPADAVHELVAINTTLSYVTVVDRNTGTELPPAGIPAGNYFYKLHIVVKAEFESSMYNSVNVTVGVNGMKLTTSEGSANAWKPTFDIWVKNIWNTTQQSGESDEQYAARVWEPILGDRTGEEAKVAFSTGFLSLSEDYNFTIASIPVVDRTKTIDGVASEWRITLIKSDAEYEATGKYIPNAETGGNASAGDYFFFTGIDMPWAYVLWAEEKLNAYKETELAKLKQINPTWIIRIDKVRANTKEQGELEYLADRFASGAKLKVKDKRFTNGQVLTLYVQTVTYTWQEPSSGNPYLVPDIEVVLSDKIEVSADPVTQLEGDVQNIQSTYAKISDIENAIRRVASPIFLKKTGESERSLSPTRFSSLMASESFRQGDIGGQGWGAYTDGEGHSVLEADTIVVRKDMRVNTLTINQIAYLGGKQIISAAAMECTKVDDTDSGYVCYFDQKQGSVANLFKVDDIVLGQVWNADESEQRYYKRKVIAVSTDSITLSKDIADGDGVPQPKDIMVQYGSYSDTSRQYVIVRDVIGGGYERMLSGLTTVYANGDEYYFAGRQSGSTPRWFVGDANGQHASYQNGVLNITGRLSVTTQVDKGNGTYESLSNYLSNLQDQIDGNIQTWYATGVPTLQNYPASTWPTVEDKNNHIGDLYYESETGKAYRFMLDGNTYKWIPIADEDIAAALALAQQNQTAIAGLAYLKAATNQGTLVQGGLVLTSMIQLGETEEGTYKVYSGINGIMDTTALGNGIAAWYGGPMADIGADSTLTDFAKSLFRFDGSGYLASGNIKWDLNGNGEIPGISWNNGRITLSPDIYLQGGDRLTAVVDAVNRMYTQFAYDSHDNIVVKPTDAFYIPTSAPEYPLAGGVALWYDYNGNYSEIPSGGIGDVYDLTLRSGSTLLGVFQPGVEDKTIDLSPMLSGYATQSWVSANFNNYVLPTASASVLGGIKIGTGLTIDATGVVSVTGQTQGTVTRVDLGTTQYSPNDSGVVTLPSYPTTLPASDVSAWAKKSSLEASDVPTLAISKISGLQDALDGKQPLDADLTAIAALTGSGLLKRNSDNTWSLDTNTYLTSSDHKALTLKVGTATVGSDYNSLAAKTYTITKQHLTDTIGNTTYAEYNEDGYLPLSAGYEKPLTNALYSQSILPTADMTYSLGDTSKRFGGGFFGLLSVSIYGTISWADISSALSIPTTAPDTTDDDFYDSTKSYLWADADGNYSELPSGGGVADIYDLTLRRGSVSVGPYNLGEQAADIDLASLFSGYATESWVGNRISALNLGTASQKDFVTTIVSGGAGLPTAGTIYTFVNNAVTAAQPYKGVSSTAITDGGTEMPTISGYTTRTKGDVVAYNKKEFIWEGDKWRELGDEGSYALKTVQVIAGTGLAGGGAISQDVTLSLSSATQASLALADSALQSSDLDGYVNDISQTSGNYVTGITKSGKTLTITRGTLPTTIALSNVTGADDLKAIEALTGTSGLLKKTAANTWALDTNSYLVSSSLKDLTLQVNGETAGTYNPNTAATINLPITEFATSEEQDAMFTSRQVPSVAVGDVCKITSVKGKSVVWNQLAQNLSSSQASSKGLTSSFDNGIITLNGVVSSAGYIGFAGLTHVQRGRKYSHKILIRMREISGTRPSTFNILDGYATSTSKITPTSPVAIYTTPTSGNWDIRIANLAVNDAFTDYKFRFEFIDLTVAGLDDLTAAEFETLYPGYSDYSTGELVNNTASGVEMLDAGGNSLGTIPLNITGLTSGGVQIFPDGMKSAGTAYDEWSGTTATKRIGVVDLGTLTWTRENVYGRFTAGLQSLKNRGPRLIQIFCNKYIAKVNGESFDSSWDKVIYGVGLSIYVHDTAYTSAADFKAAMNGVYLYYEQATPETYTVDALPDTLVAFDAAGTQRRLPVDTSEDVAAPMVCDFQYGANIGDLLPTVDYKIRHGHVALADEAIKLQTARTIWGQSFDGTANVSGALTEVTDITGTGLITMPNAKFSALLAVPSSAPSSIVSGETYLWCDTTGAYSVVPSGGGGSTGDIYPLTIVVNGVQTVYDPSEQRQTLTLAIPTSLASLTDDATHRLVTDTQISTWDAKQDAISDLTTIRSNANLGAAAYGWGDHRQAGYLTSYTETDPVFSASAAAGITSGNISDWNGKQDSISDLATIRSNASTAATAVDVQQGSGLGIDSNGHLMLDSHDAADVLGLGSAAFKGYDTAVTSGSANLVTSGAVYTTVSAKYTKPSTGIPKTDLASAVQTSLGKADTALQSVAFSDLTSHPTTIAGYGITDAKIANGTITLGSNSITPLTSFTETDPTVPAWAKAESKPTYTLDEIANGTTRSLANYLPLAGGTMTGNLTFNTSTTKSIYANNGTLNQRIMLMDSSGSLSIGYDLPDNSNSLSLYGYSISLRYGSTNKHYVYMNETNGTIYGLENMVSATPGTYNLGSTNNRWLGVYANIINAATGLTTAGTLSVTGNSTFTGNLVPNTTNATDIGSSSKKFKDIYSIGTIYADGSLSIPTAAPSNPVSTKTYLWCDTTGNYAESLQS